MRRLHHFKLCPFSRKIRLFLKEKSLDFRLVDQNSAAQEKEPLVIDPSGQIPLLVDALPHSENEEALITGAQPIVEYLEEVYREKILLGDSPLERAEVRRLINWLDYRVFHDVVHPALEEKVLKRLRREGAPDSQRLRKAHQAMNHHFNFLEWLLSQRNCLATESLSGADFTAAAHLSVLDYLGLIPWSRHPNTYAWYARLKSRPAFRPLLEDQFPGIAPPKHYTALDF